MKKTLILLCLSALTGAAYSQNAPVKAPTVDPAVTTVKAEVPAPANGALPAPANAALPVPAKVPPGVLDGVWVPEHCEYQGKDELDPKLKEALRLSIEKGEHKLYFLTDPVKMVGQRLSKAELTVDAKKGEFELAMNDGQRKGEKVHGIYELSGDTLKMCYGPSTEARPTKFEAKAEQKDVFNETWTRFKTKK